MTFLKTPEKLTKVVSERYCLCCWRVKNGKEADLCHLGCVRTSATAFALRRKRRRRKKVRERDSRGVMHDMWCRKCSLKPSKGAERAEIKERLWRGVVMSTDKKTHNYLWKEEGANLNLFLARLTSHLETAGVKSVKYTCRTCMSHYLLHRPVNELIYIVFIFFSVGSLLFWFGFALLDI